MLKIYMKALICIIGIIILGAGCSKKVKLEDCIIVTYLGCDEYGTVNAEVDFDKLENILLSSNNGNISEEKVFQFEESIKCNVDQKEKLSNGDKVKVRVSYDDALAKAMKIHFNNVEKTYTVEGLKKAKELTEEELFKDVEVEFTGVSPNISVNITSDSENSFIQQVQFSAEKVSGLKLNDEVKVVAKIDEKTALLNGFILKNSSKKYKVEGVDSYLLDFDTLSSDQKNELKSLADQVYADNIENIGLYSNLEIIKNGSQFYALLGYEEKSSNKQSGTPYFSTIKHIEASNNFSEFNALCLMYTMDFTNLSNGISNVEDLSNCSVGIWIKNIILQKDGSIDMNKMKTEIGNIYTSKEACYDAYIGAIESEYDIKEVTMN